MFYNQRDFLTVTVLRLRCYCDTCT